MAAPHWLLDELAHAGAEHLDAAFVRGYDRKQGPVAHEAAVADLEVFAQHGIGAAAHVLDLGCGTGTFTLAARPRVGHVTAVDPSPVMLDRLRARLGAAGEGAEVTCVRAGALTYDHAGPPVDAVHSRNALHQLPDTFKALALTRIAAVLRPGGVLRLRDLVYDTTPAELAGVLEAWFAAAATDPAEGYTREELATHVRTEHSTFSWLLEPMLDAAGFDVVERSFRRSVYGAYTCIRR